MSGTTISPHPPTHEKEHHLFPIGGATALVSAEAAWEFGVPIVRGLWKAGVSEGGSFLSRFASGAGPAGIATMVVTDVGKVGVGTLVGDKTIVGDGVGEAIGITAGMAATGLVLAFAPVEAPIALGALGLAAVVGGDGGQVLRDYVPGYRHFTDDVVGQTIINHVPESIRKPGERIFNQAMDRLDDAKHYALGVWGSIETHIPFLHHTTEIAPPPATPGRPATARHFS